MIPEIWKNEVVQFNENHKWCGCLGIVDEVETINNDVRYMVGVPIPEQGVAYIYVTRSEGAIEPVGRAILVKNYEDKNEGGDE